MQETPQDKRNAARERIASPPAGAAKRERRAGNDDPFLDPDALRALDERSQRRRRRLVIAAIVLFIVGGLAAFNAVHIREILQEVRAPHVTPTKISLGGGPTHRFWPVVQFLPRSTGMELALHVDDEYWTWNATSGMTFHFDTSALPHPLLKVFGITSDFSAHYFSSGPTIYRFDYTTNSLDRIHQERDRWFSWAEPLPQQVDTLLVTSMQITAEQRDLLQRTTDFDPATDVDVAPPGVWDQSIDLYRDGVRTTLWSAPALPGVRLSLGNATTNPAGDRVAINVTEEHGATGHEYFTYVFALELTPDGAELTPLFKHKQPPANFFTVWNDDFDSYVADVPGRNNILRVFLPKNERFDFATPTLAAAKAATIIPEHTPRVSPIDTPITTSLRIDLGWFHLENTAVMQRVNGSSVLFWSPWSGKRAYISIDWTLPGDMALHSRDGRFLYRAHGSDIEYVDLAPYIAAP